MKTSKFWPLVDDPEGEIYETLAWDLPGFRQASRRRRPQTRNTIVIRPDRTDEARLG